MKKISLITLFSFIIIFLIQINSGAQSYRFMEYSAKDGLCDNFVYNLIQDENGYLWVGTGEGICRYDGISFQSDFKGDTLPKTPVKKSYRDSQGRIWFGYDNGQVALLEDRSFKLISPAEDQLSAI
ncbi:MAG: two-component regulator propeller domain-containing protein, partial [Bacteroidales bacterium]